MTTQDVLTVEQVADILHISKNTIQRKSYREKTGIPLKKRGRRLYTLAAEFYKWLKG
ncbi:MAG: helix-turn-helix domain-containing protein [Planctomycetota bacterium]|jgi:hypothetical protein